MLSPRSLPSRLHELVLSPAARPLRFAGTGGLAGVTQLLLLAVMTRHGWKALPANAVAFVLAAQVNFVLSLTLTWRDRGVAGSLPRRWLLYHASISLMALVNMLTFAAARTALPILIASLAGIAAGGLGNYLAGDRLVFREPATAGAQPTERRTAA